MDWLGDNQWAGWLALAIGLGVAEMFSLDLILIMVAVGAIAGMLTGVLGAPFLLQVLVAAGASIAMLALVRPNMIKRLHTGPDLQLGHGKLVGQRGVVTERITYDQPGRIRLAGEIWTAAPYDEHLTITPGETVEVFEIRGATAYVHPVPTLES
ncbi:NfeD family protein [Nocardioides ungokensis]|jgi:membrane protein implicated in regulation of membrane protease activity|uniref:NfeD family protein n=1 Tax=Nocardioides ungokensis TaxID=1643322 RepID=UPI0015DE28C3|nr:NfeD family protein [Nocardioides ungokensis]